MMFVKRVWVLFAVWSLQASLSLAADLPGKVTHATFPTPGSTSVLLGRDLFFDPILSGNRDTTCASCHMPPSRADDLPVVQTVAHKNRDVPALYNLGAYEFTTLMPGGAVTHDTTERFQIKLPGGLYLERPVPSPLAAQTLLPLIAPAQMAGHPGENPIADAVAADHVMGLHGAWQMIAQRVQDIPEYQHRFAVLTGPGEPIHITDIARVLADYMAFEFRATNSRFDAFQNGDISALSANQQRGMSLFYGKATCASCHSGAFQTDHNFYATGLTQVNQDRAAITGDMADLYRVRTPSLRNITLTAPYGPTGSFDDLGQMIRYHLNPQITVATYSDSATNPGFGTGLTTDIAPTQLTDADINALIAFLGTLTDPTSSQGRLGVPDTVPSGLAVAGQNPPS